MPAKNPPTPSAPVQPPAPARNLSHVELYTDGACSGNPGPGGWAYILRHANTGKTVEHSGGDRETTNNRMEMIAVIEGLTALRDPCQVDLYSDSQYVIKGMSEWLNGWKKKNWKRSNKQPVLNIDLWKQLDALRDVHRIAYHWIRGHNEHPENERCDELAVAAIEAFRSDDD